MSRRPVVVTQPEYFGRYPEGALFSVNEGMPITVALEHASNLLACVDDLTVIIGGGTGQGSEAYAIQFLAEMAKALVDACASAALRAEGSQ